MNSLNTVSTAFLLKIFCCVLLLSNSENQQNNESFQMIIDTR